MSRGRLELQIARDEGRVRVSVIDDGPGIPDDIRPHIFEPFFTTKPAGEGSGLGLDIVSRLVAEMSGDIQVHSRPGRTEFRVTLPIDTP